MLYENRCDLPYCEDCTVSDLKIDKVEYAGALGYGVSNYLSCEHYYACKRLVEQFDGDKKDQ